MEVGILQAVCNNRPTESSSPENGWRSNARLMPGRMTELVVRVRGRVGSEEAFPWGDVEQPAVQILVVVANT